MSDITAGPEGNTNETIDAPSALRLSDHWVLLKEKKPVNKEGVTIDGTDSPTWMPFNEALEAFQSAPGKFTGLGYIVHHDPSRGDNQIIGGELDNCRDPITGWISPWAQSILSTINGCTSVSISGCGFRFFCLGKLPDEINKVIGHGPDDLTVEAMTNIMDKKPDIKDKYAMGEPTWNGLEIYESGPRHLTITGEWLPGYPEDLPRRTSEIEEVIAPFLKPENPKEAPKKTPDPTEPPAPEDQGDKLPFLSILQVINTSGFTKEGDVLVGPHPIFGSSTGSNLKVNISKNSWYYIHAGNEISGDPWIWLACECGAIAWVDCEAGAIRDELVLAEVKQFAVEKGYFKHDELFQEDSPLDNALRLVAELKEMVLQDPGLPFEQKYVNALNLIWIQDQPEFERIKYCLKGKVSWRDLFKLIKVASITIEGDEEPSQESYSKYISWRGKLPILLTGPLLEDILTDLKACVIEGTEKDLAIYNTRTGTYDIGKSAMRLILRESARRIKLDGDPSLECFTPKCISIIRSLGPALALEVGDEFEKMVSFICVGNGAVDLKTCHIIEWSPDWYMVQYTPVKYTPGKDWRELAPTFTEALEKTFDGDKDRHGVLSALYGLLRHW